MRVGVGVYTMNEWLIVYHMRGQENLEKLPPTRPLMVYSAETD